MLCPPCSTYIQLFCPPCSTYIQLFCPPCYNYIQLFCPPCSTYIQLFFPPCSTYIQLILPTLFYCTYIYPIYFAHTYCFISQLFFLLLLLYNIMLYSRTKGVKQNYIPYISGSVAYRQYSIYTYTSAVVYGTPIGSRR